MVSRTFQAFELKDKPLRVLRTEFTKRFASDPAGMSKRVMFFRIAYHEEITEFLEKGQAVPDIVQVRSGLVNRCTTDWDLVRVGILEPFEIGETGMGENGIKVELPEQAAAQKTHCPAFGKAHDPKDVLCVQCGEKFPDVSTECIEKTKETKIVAEQKVQEKAKKAAAARAAKPKADSKVVAKPKAKSAAQPKKNPAVQEDKLKTKAEREGKAAKAKEEKAAKKAKAKAEKEAKAAKAKEAKDAKKAKVQAERDAKKAKVKAEKAKRAKPTKMAATAQLLMTGKYTVGELKIEVAKMADTKTLASAAATVDLAMMFAETAGILKTDEKTGRLSI